MSASPKDGVQILDTTQTATSPKEPSTPKDQTPTSDSPKETSLFQDWKTSKGEYPKSPKEPSTPKGQTPTSDSPKEASLFQDWKESKGEYPKASETLPKIHKSSRSASASVCSARSYAASVQSRHSAASAQSCRSCCSCESARSRGGASSVASSNRTFQSSSSFGIGGDEPWTFSTSYDQAFNWVLDGSVKEEFEGAIKSRADLKKKRRDSLRRAALLCLDRQQERDRKYEQKIKNLIMKRRKSSREAADLEFKEAYDFLVKKREGYFPDPSFDLDNDGVVGVRDYYIASRFDADKDGRLNTPELANARRAIAKGFAQNKFNISNKDANIPKGHYYSYQGTFHRFLGQADDADEWKALNTISSALPDY